MIFLDQPNNTRPILQILNFYQTPQDMNSQSYLQQPSQLYQSNNNQQQQSAPYQPQQPCCSFGNLTNQQVPQNLQQQQYQPYSQQQQFNSQQQYPTSSAPYQQQFTRVTPTPQPLFMDYNQQQQQQQQQQQRQQPNFYAQNGVQYSNNAYQQPTWPQNTISRIVNGYGNSSSVKITSRTIYEVEAVIQNP